MMDDNSHDGATGAKPRRHGRVYNGIIETIGETPMVRLSRLAAEANSHAEILGKCEFFNPLSSVKDRIGLAMIEAAEAAGRIGPKTVLVEPTSGNTGLALAFICAAKGYRLILTMPESMTADHLKMMALLGAEIERTPSDQGMTGAVRRAEQLVTQLKDAVTLQQFENPANPDAHRHTTAAEIWADCDGKVDYVVCGVGTGGTLTGIAEGLKPLNPSLKIIAVEPEDSAVLSGGVPGQHKIQGIGAGFVPHVLKTGLIDEIITISNDTAFSVARQVARLEGLPVGVSAGAALGAAIELGRRAECKDKVIVTILPSFAERYLSTPLFEGLGEDVAL
jgi:cysteine synthase